MGDNRYMGMGVQEIDSWDETVFVFSVVILLHGSSKLMKCNLWLCRQRMQKVYQHKCCCTQLVYIVYILRICFIFKKMFFSNMFFGSSFGRKKGSLQLSTLNRSSETWQRWLDRRFEYKRTTLLCFLISQHRLRPCRRQTFCNLVLTLQRFRLTFLLWVHNRSQRRLRKA